MTTTISGSNGIVFPDDTTMQTGQQAVKAWVNFDGTGTVAIRAGYNVSSISDNGTGDYTVNFTTAMLDANFTYAGSVGDSDHSSQSRGISFINSTVSTLRILTEQTGGTNSDEPQIGIVIFR
tara:strand:+ start:245 stop:610 length:366 start_codon:yes stop_codon:yes gene_type:complete